MEHAENSVKMIVGWTIHLEYQVEWRDGEQGRWLYWEGKSRSANSSSCNWRCCCWRLWIAPIKVFICCTIAAIYCCYGVATNRETLRSSSAAGGAAWCVERHVELIEAPWDSDCLREFKLRSHFPSWHANLLPSFFDGMVDREMNIAPKSRTAKNLQRGKFSYQKLFDARSSND